MDRVPLADVLPYTFLEPRISRFWLALGRGYAERVYLRRQRQVVAIEAQGLDRLGPLFDRGDGVLLTPNHPDSADSGVMLTLSGRAGRAFSYMAAYQIFQGSARFLLPRVGAFPVDREGTDLKAFKAGVEILGRGDPLVIFPEGEIYHTCDRLTPIREGAAAIAVAAVKRAGARGKAVSIVPVATKYRFLDGADPLPAIEAKMAALETRLAWRPRPNEALVDRIYAYAGALLGLKEIEYLGDARSGPIPARIAALRDAILDALELRHPCKRRGDTPPVRAKELRRACLDILADPAVTPEAAARAHVDLDDVFVALQLFSYPGDYLRDAPTVERVAETVTKFAQDVLGEDEPAPFAPRHAIVRLGDPIDASAFVAGSSKPREAVGALAHEIETRIQALLDAIGPGRLLDPSCQSRGGIAPRLERVATPAPASP